jgi:hypothetical protein
MFRRPKMKRQLRPVSETSRGIVWLSGLIFLGCCAVLGDIDIAGDPVAQRRTCGAISASTGGRCALFAQRVQIDLAKLHENDRVVKFTD